MNADHNATNPVEAFCSRHRLRANDLFEPMNLVYALAEIYERLVALERATEVKA